MRMASKGQPTTQSPKPRQEYWQLSTPPRNMAAAAQEAGVQIVTGDTKVVQRGACDQMFINTTGIGHLLVQPEPSGHRARPGDVVLVSGAVGDHGLVILFVDLGGGHHGNAPSGKSRF